MRCRHRKSGFPAILPALNDRIHAASIATSVHAPCHATVIVNATACGGQQIVHAACLVVIPREIKEVLSINPGGSQVPPPSSNAIFMPPPRDLIPLSSHYAYNLTAYFQMVEQIAQLVGNASSESGFLFCSEFLDSLGIFLVNNNKPGSVTQSRSYYFNNVSPFDAPSFQPNIIVIFIIRFNSQTSDSAIYSVFQRYVRYWSDTPDSPI